VATPPVVVMSPTDSPGSAPPVSAAAPVSLTLAVINVGNSVVQKPLDQIVITGQPKAQTLVCR